MCTGDAIHCEDAAVLVDALEEVRREEATLHARRAELIDALRRTNVAHEQQIVIGVDRPAERAEFVERSTRAQVACARRVSERLAGRLIRDAVWLAAELPVTRHALQRGEISYLHAVVLIREIESLPAAMAGDFERAVLAGRADIPAGRFAVRCRRTRERIHPSTIDDRAAAAERSRGVSVEHARDGMSWLMAYLPAMQAELAHVLLTGVAKDEQDAGDPRTLDQLRADALVDALLRTDRAGVVPEGAGSVRDQPVAVSITIPALTLLGASDEPAVLDGYGPIPLETAKVLAAQAPTWRRILTHPVTGVRLIHDRERYRVPADLRAWLRDRDETCRFPGCSRKARGCDLDHSIAWEHGGCTDHDNLAHLCRSHHRLKHHSRWSVRFEDDVLVWTDPTGHDYTSAPSAEYAARSG